MPLVSRRLPRMPYGAAGTMPDISARPLIDAPPPGDRAGDEDPPRDGPPRADGPPAGRAPISRRRRPNRAAMPSACASSDGRAAPRTGYKIHSARPGPGFAFLRIDRPMLASAKGVGHETIARAVLVDRNSGGPWAGTRPGGGAFAEDASSGHRGDTLRLVAHGAGAVRCNGGAAPGTCRLRGRAGEDSCRGT